MSEPIKNAILYLLEKEKKEYVEKFLEKVQSSTEAFLNKDHWHRIAIESDEYRYIEELIEKIIK